MFKRIFQGFIYQSLDNEKGLFGWVYDIMIIKSDKVVKLRVDAGTQQFCL